MEVKKNKEINLLKNNITNISKKMTYNNEIIHEHQNALKERQQQ